MLFRVLPLIAGLLPLAGVIIAYKLGVDAGALPSCIPFVDGCTSISATGRYMPGSMVFRAAMLPQAALLIVIWWIAVRWLDAAMPNSRRNRVILISGIIGAIALVVYVTFLGTKTPLYEFMRRFGIYFYFLGTALSQLLFTLALPRSKIRRLMFWTITTPFVLGLANIALKVLLEDSDRIENGIEWVSALLMQLWFVQLYFVWRNAGLDVTVTDSTSADR